MKRNEQANAKPKDTPVTRKRRLQQRLRELSDRSDQEMANVMKSIEKLKSAFRSDKS